MTNTLDSLDPWRLQTEWLASVLFFHTYCHLHIVTGKQFLFAFNKVSFGLTPFPLNFGVWHIRAILAGPFCKGHLKGGFRTSLVAHWVRIHPTMQGTQVRSLVQEDSTCHGATKPVWHNYWACTLQILKSACLEPVLCSKRSPRNEKPRHCSQKYSPLSN